MAITDITIPRRVAIIQSNLGSEDKVLEIGCKEGRLTHHLEAKEIIGVDIDEKAIVEAKEKEKRPNVKFLVGDAYDLKFSNEEFDVVIMGDIIEHLYNGNKALSEANRVLKKGGKLLVSCPYHGMLKNIVITFYNYDRHYDVEGEHIRFFTVKSLTRLLKKNGFRVNKKHFIGRAPFLWRSMLFVCVKG
ncbi:MAG: class I SAM-dependent methyltransferase [Candidatus Aenigmatarchaeota archaeon]